NPTGTGFILKAPYVNNVLPAGEFDAVAKGLAALYPAPNVPGTINYQTNLRNTFDENRFGGRVDHHLSDHDSIFGRYNYDDVNQKATTWSDLLGPTTQNKTNGQNFVVSETHIFRPNLVNELRAGYTRSRPYRLLTAPNRDLQGELGLTGFPFLPNMPTGFFQFGGFLQIQSVGRRSGYYNDLGTVRDYADNLSWITGRHSLRFGAELRFVRFTHFESQAPRGDFQFPGRAGDELNAVDTQGNPLAVGFAQFLTGL